MTSKKTRFDIADAAEPSRRHGRNPTKKQVFIAATGRESMPAGRDVKTTASPQKP